MEKEEGGRGGAARKSSTFTISSRSSEIESRLMVSNLMDRQVEGEPRPKGGGGRKGSERRKERGFIYLFIVCVCVYALAFTYIQLYKSLQASVDVCLH